MPGQNHDPSLHNQIAQIWAELRRLRVTGGASFDPNEDPVLIGGSSANIDDGVSGIATPSHPTVGGYTGAVVIGRAAFGAGQDVVSIGNGADAGATSSVSIGPSSQTTGIGDTAVGPGAVASGNGNPATAYGSASTAASDFATAYGASSYAAGQPSSGSAAFGAGAAAHNPDGGLAAGNAATIAVGSDRCTACGAFATATGQDSALLGNGTSDGGFTNVVALGSGTAATVDNQTALGNLTTPTFAETVQGLVVIDSVLNTRAMITVANGVVTLVAAP